MRAGWWIAGASVAIVAAVPASAQSARDLLVQAAFQDRSVDTALAHIDRARALAQGALQRDGDDVDAAILLASTTGYRAKLTGDRSQALAARRQFEALVARFPRNAEAQACLGAWHIGIIQRVGRIVGRAAAGAREGIGFTALDRSVTLGGNRAFFAGLAGLLRLNLNPDDPAAVALIESASRAPTPTPLDRLLQRAAQAVLVPLRSGDRKSARKLADRLLPFGWYED